MNDFDAGEQRTFAAMLRAVQMNAEQAFHTSMAWERLRHRKYGASSAVQVFHPWAAPETGTLWHKAYVRGSHTVSQELRERVCAFVEFWETVDFTIGPGLTDDWKDHSIPDAERALIKAHEIRQAGYEQSYIIRVARAGRFDELHRLVQDGIPQDYINTLFG